VRGISVLAHRILLDHQSQRPGLVWGGDGGVRAEFISHESGSIAGDRYNSPDNRLSLVIFGLILSLNSLAEQSTRDVPTGNSRLSILSRELEVVDFGVVVVWLDLGELE
jgi:hypothetical protein